MGIDGAKEYQSFKGTTQTGQAQPNEPPTKNGHQKLPREKLRARCTWACRRSLHFRGALFLAQALHAGICGSLISHEANFGSLIRKLPSPQRTRLIFRIRISWNGTPGLIEVPQRSRGIGRDRPDAKGDNCKDFPARWSAPQALGDPWAKSAWWFFPGS